MSQEDSHFIRNSIIALVVGSLIYAVITSSWLRKIPTAIFSFIKHIISLLFSWLSSNIVMPKWLICILLILALYPIFKLFKYIIKIYKKTDQTLNKPYNEDNIFGVIWRWDGTGDWPRFVMPYCPICDNELVCQEQRKDFLPVSLLYHPHFTKFVCERCGVSSDELPGDHDNAIERVEREIRRRSRVSQRETKTVVEPNQGESSASG